eukprot:gnl/MRDRNA2_/MRDRNA2_124331_c0_seq1.p1 gnl/MRDRNA2_/MRDRNA2_124331_c0~~gnl/MRDRNA2_/MRDRNA2_124331_c0_seq1.p1  ORF type:complete len:131 (-),score=19.30 gnl/MRDRNA2_/MRDRNA2_124331_c0_seq1:35-427(-)
MFFISPVCYGRIPREIVFSVAKGMYGRQNRCFQLAVRRVMKHLHHDYKQRQSRSRKIRFHWITRINAASREWGLPYSYMMNGLRRANIHVDRKSLNTLAETEPVSFKVLVDEAKRISWYDTSTKRDLKGF